MSLQRILLNWTGVKKILTELKWTEVLELKTPLTKRQTKSENGTKWTELSLTNSLPFYKQLKRRPSAWYLIPHLLLSLSLSIVYYRWYSWYFNTLNFLIYSYI